MSHGANLAIAQQFGWSDHSNFVDVGTAQGSKKTRPTTAPHSIR